MNDRIRARTWSNCAGVFGTWMAIGILPPRQVIVGIQTSNEKEISHPAIWRKSWHFFSDASQVAGLASSIG